MDIKLFIEQKEVNAKYLEYDAGSVFEYDNGDFIIGNNQIGAERTFSIGQPVYDWDGNLMGYLGIGLYSRLTNSDDRGVNIPAYYWKICLPTEHCCVGKRVRTCWQNKERLE